MTHKQHGHFSGGAMSPTYKSWQAMKSRCDRPSNVAYSRYGGAGKGYDPRWNSFVNFLEDMGERPEDCSLDRVDNDKGYSKENCRWADRLTQANNRKDVHYLSLGDRTQSVADWARELGMKPDTLYNRVRKGWSAERCLKTPLRNWTRHGQK